MRVGCGCAGSLRDRRRRACWPRIGLRIPVGMIDTASRPSEIRTWQWKNLNLQRRPWGCGARKEKTRRDLSGMLATRLWQLLEMRQLDPSGRPWPGEAYVFGDEIGRLLAL